MKLIKRFQDGGKYVNVPLWSLDPMKRSEINNYMESQGLNPNSLSQLFAFTDAPASMQEGGEFQENLEPPSRGFLGEMKNNIYQGNEIFGKMIGSPAVQLVLGGITSGLAGMFGPTMKVSRTAKELVSNPRNTIRKFARNITAKKGDPSYRWTQTSGNVTKGRASDYTYEGMSNKSFSKVMKTGKGEGSGYNAQSILDKNPTYQKASNPAQTPFQRTWNNQRSVPIEQQASRQVMQRNNLIDQARDWRNYVFEGPYGKLNFKIKGFQVGGPIEKADNTRVQKPIPGVIPKDSYIRTYDTVPTRVDKGYPYNDTYYLGNPARPMYSHDKNIKLNAIYPSVRGVELDVLTPEYIQKIEGKDTTYYVQGDKGYYPVAGYQSRPIFREAFKNPKARVNKPNYFDTPEKIDKTKQVIANQQK